MCQAGKTKNKKPAITPDCVTFRLVNGKVACHSTGCARVEATVLQGTLRGLDG